jgi:hypothetical protein
MLTLLQVVKLHALMHRQAHYVTFQYVWHCILHILHTVCMHDTDWYALVDNRYGGADSSESEEDDNDDDDASSIGNAHSTTSSISNPSPFKNVRSQHHNGSLTSSHVRALCTDTCIHQVLQCVTDAVYSCCRS